MEAPRDVGSAAPPARVCAVCGAEAVSQCVNCKVTAYCSRRCQKRHWSRGGHKGRCFSPQERAAYTKWVVWSNSELDGLCFGAIPGDHRVRGESMSRPDIKQVAILNAILSEREWLVGDSFTVADAAVASCVSSAEPARAAAACPACADECRTQT